MTDTVTKLMARVHVIENLASLVADPMSSGREHMRYVNDLIAARDTLQDELTRLFTPLSEIEVIEGFCEQPIEGHSIKAFTSGVRWAEQQHGINK